MLYVSGSSSSGSGEASRIDGGGSGGGGDVGSKYGVSKFCVYSYISNSGSSSKISLRIILLLSCVPGKYFKYLGREKIFSEEEYFLSGFPDFDVLASFMGVFRRDSLSSVSSSESLIENRNRGRLQIGSIDT